MPEEATAKSMIDVQVSQDNIRNATKYWTTMKDNTHLYNEKKTIEEVYKYRLAGGNTIVDVTSIGIGRDPKALARISRATVLELKNRPFILSSKVMGFGDIHIIIKEMLPNIIAPLVVTFTFTIPSVILAESTLSFLGLGISPPNVSWGLMANNGWEGIRSYPHLIIFPCLAIFVSTITFLRIGDKLKSIS